MEPEAVMEMFKGSGQTLHNHASRRTFCCGDRDLYGAGELSDEELLAKLFEVIDYNGDGRLDKREILTAMTQPYIRASLQHLFPHISTKEIFESLDVNLDRCITLDEFQDAFIGKGQKQLLLSQASLPLTRGMAFEFSSEKHGDHSQEFPLAMPSFRFVPTVGLTPADLRCGNARNYRQSAREMKQTRLVWRCDVRKESLQKTEALQSVLQKLPKGGIGDSIFGCLSPMSSISSANFPIDGGVPEEAEWFVWSYPFEADWHAAGVQQNVDVDPDVAFLSNGGFVYFDKTFNVVRLDAALVDPKGSVVFGPPQEVAGEWYTKVVHTNRLRPITNRAFLRKGATDFCWILPDESIPTASGQVVQCRHGGFAYFGQDLGQQIEGLLKIE